MGKKLLTIILGIIFALPAFSWGQIFDDTFISFEVEGRSRMVITDPSGQRVGSHGFDVWNETSNAEQDLRYNTHSVTYTNPTPGNYRIDFRGQYDENYNWNIVYFDGSNYQDVDFTRWNSSAEITSITITLEGNSEQWRIESPVFQPPLGRAIKTDSGLVGLEWRPVEQAAGYRVYYKYWDYPYYSYLVTTAATNTATEISWATDSGDPMRPDNLYYFVVTAVSESGDETVFSPIITNADQDGDGYNDWREQALGTSATTSDTDADGVDDFAEINRYYTDPLVADTDGDGFTDGAELEAGTLPNQAESYPGRVNECGAPQSGDWHVGEHCTVTDDQNVPADIVVHPDSVLTLRERVTLWFDYTQHKILVMFGGGINIQGGAQIRQK